MDRLRALLAAGATLEWATCPGLRYVRHQGRIEMAIGPATLRAARCQDAEMDL